MSNCICETIDLDKPIRCPYIDDDTDEMCQYCRFYAQCREKKGTLGDPKQ